MIGVLADLHFGIPSEDSDFNQKDNQGFPVRLMHIHAAAKNMARQLRSEGCKDMVLLGDILDKGQSIDKYTFEVITDFFASLSMLFKDGTIYTIPGNHDWSGSCNDLVHTLANRFRNVFHIFGSETAAEIQGVRCLFVPWYPKVEERINAMTLEECKCSVMFGHLCVNGGKAGSGEYTVENGVRSELLDEAFKACMFGHFHRAQNIGKSSVYVGSPLQHNFGESGNEVGGGIFDPRTHTYRHMNPVFRSPKYWIMRMPDKATAWPHEDGVNTDYVWIRCSGRDMVDAAKDYAQRMDLQHVRITVDNGAPRRASVHKVGGPSASLNTMMGVYLRDEVKDYEKTTRKMAYNEFRKMQ